MCVCVFQNNNGINIIPFINSSVVIYRMRWFILLLMFHHISIFEYIYPTIFKFGTSLEMQRTIEFYRGAAKCKKNMSLSPKFDINYLNMFSSLLNYMHRDEVKEQTQRARQLHISHTHISASIEH